MKTFTLDVEYECDFDLFGVVSSSREHMLAWQLNQVLRLRLIKQQDLIYDLLQQGRTVRIDDPKLFKLADDVLQLLFAGTKKPRT